MSQGLFFLILFHLFIRLFFKGFHKTLQQLQIISLKQKHFYLVFPQVFTEF